MQTLFCEALFVFVILPSGRNGKPFLNEISLYLSVFTESHQPFQYIFHLSHIAGIVVVHQEFPYLIIHMLYFFLQIMLNEGKKVRDQAGQILTPGAKRRYGNGDGVDSVEQILSKISSGHFLRQTPIGSADQTEIQRNDPIAANPFNGSGFQDSQQLDLGVIGKLSDLIQKQGAKICFLKASGREGTTVNSTGD